MIDPEDTISRPPITNLIRDRIRDEFAMVPEGKRSALIGIWDAQAEQARLHLAWKINSTWKVGAQVGWTKNHKPDGYVGIEAVW